MLVASGSSVRGRCLLGLRPWSRRARVRSCGRVGSSRSVARGGRIRLSVLPCPVPSSVRAGSGAGAGGSLVARPSWCASLLPPVVGRPWLASCRSRVRRAWFRPRFRPSVSVAVGLALGRRSLSRAAWVCGWSCSGVALARRCCPRRGAGGSGWRFRPPKAPRRRQSRPSRKRVPAYPREYDAEKRAQYRTASASTHSLHPQPARLDSTRLDSTFFFCEKVCQNRSRTPHATKKEGVEMWTAPKA